MPDIEGLRDIISRALDEEEGVRDRTFSLSRNLIRSCRRAISDIVQEKDVDLSDLTREKEELVSEAGPNGQIYGFIGDALTEYSEAFILHSVINGRGLPFPSDLGTSERVYILGACDAVGELRRITLNRLMRSDIRGASWTYERMKEIGHLIEGLVYPSGMIPLKKKQDVVRSLLDRTGGELAVALNFRKDKGEGGLDEQ
jgi:translin